MTLTRDELRRYLSERFGIEADGLDDDAPLFSDGLLDSFSMVELINFIESTEGIKVGAMDVQLENLDSVARILRFVDAKSSTAGGC